MTRICSIQNSLPATLMLVIGCTIVVHSAQAADPIQWKLAAGDELKYEIAKSSALTLNDESSVYRLSQTVNVTWHVANVDDDETATIEQKVDRIRLELDDPLGKVDYDSDVDDEPGSLAALAAVVFSAMLEHPIQFQLAPTGAIDEINIPVPLLKAVEKVSFSKSLDRFASDEGLRGLLIPRLPVFPAGELDSDQQWNDAASAGESLSGTQRVEFSYRYTSDKEQEGDSMAVIVPTVHVINEGTNEPFELQVLKSSGELLFNRSAGRLESNHWQVELEMGDSAGEHGRLKQGFRMDLAR